MNNIRLVELNKEKEELFIQLNQESFQKGFEDYFGKTDKVVIPRKDILSSLSTKGSHAYLAIKNEEVVGGVCVVIDKETNENNLHILFVKVVVQSKGIGFAIWKEIEKMFPNTKIWRTCTPYFDQRNVHFYVNKCKFHIIEYLNSFHPGDNISDDFIGDGGKGMFEFEKICSK